MSKYKVVPVEPTPKMLQVWKSMHGYSRYNKYKAMLEAAPDVQGEPVYLYRRRGLHDFVTCSRERYAELSAKPRLFETRVLYTAPQPAPDAAGLVETVDGGVDP